MTRLALLALLAGCPAPAPDDTGPTDTGTPVDTDTDVAPTCEADAVSAYVPFDVTTFFVTPSNTAREGETIHDELQGTVKRHYVAVPRDPSAMRDELFVWLSGSGAEPQNYDHILEIAASANYLAISLAYDNETSVNALCNNEAIPECSHTALDCEEKARLEILYGADVSKCIDVPRADSVENRITRLIQFARDNRPELDAGRFLDAGGENVDWSKIAIGGWSQGGGHAGLISRDHEVARAIFVSKGGDSAPCHLVRDDPNECDRNGDGNYDPTDPSEALDPAPWTLEPRVTPGSRGFGIVHRQEDSWYYSMPTYANYGLAGADDPANIEDLGADFAAFGCAHAFTTRATPRCGATSFHKSMALDSCLALDGDGVPVLAPFFTWALTVPVE